MEKNHNLVSEVHQVSDLTLNVQQHRPVKLYSMFYCVNVNLQNFVIYRLFNVQKTSIFKVVFKPHLLHYILLYSGFHPMCAAYNYV